VLLMPGGPSVSELGSRGVRRVSVGSWLSRIAHGAMVTAAQQLSTDGVISTDNPFLDMKLAARAWTPVHP
jgi:Transglutaminase-like superfamily